MLIRKGYIFILFSGFAHSRYYLQVGKNYCGINFRNEFRTITGTFRTKKKDAYTINLIDYDYNIIRDKYDTKLLYIKRKSENYYLADISNCDIRMRDINSFHEITIFYSNECDINQNNIPTVNLLNTIEVTSFEGKKVLVQNNIIEFYVNYFSKYDKFYRIIKEPHGGFVKTTLFDDSVIYYDGNLTKTYNSFEVKSYSKHKALIFKSMSDNEVGCGIVYLNVSDRNKDLLLYSDFIEKQKELEKEKAEKDEEKKKKKKSCIICLIIIASLIGFILFLGLIAFIIECCGCYSGGSSSSGKGTFTIFTFSSHN